MSSYVSWVCSTSPDLARNMIAIIFILSAFYTTTLSTKYTFKGWPYITGLLLGFAGISHILSVFSAFPLLYFAYNSSKEKIITILKISITSTLFVLFVFYFVATKIININDIHGFLEWFRAPGGNQWFQTNLIRGIVDLILTSIRSIFGIVTYQPLKIAILSNGMENTNILLLAIFATIIISGCCLFILRSLLRTPEGFTLLSKAMMIWFCSQAIFSIFFDSGNIRMLLFLSIPFIIILYDSIKIYSSSCIALVLFILFILVFTINTSTIFYKENRPETQKSFQMLDAMNNLSHDPEDIFIVTTCTDAVFARYFGNRKTFIMDSKYPSIDSLYDIVQSNTASGHKIFILNELVNTIKEGTNKEKSPLLWTLIFDSRTLHISNNVFQSVLSHKQIPADNYQNY